MPNVLMIAFHFPPYLGGSGVHRTVKFSRYLPEFGWQPFVLTASVTAYQNTDDGQLRELADRVSISRAFALDTARHLSILGRYPKILAIPDRWVSWWLSGVVTGLNLIRKFRPACLWSTYPIATAHLIGLTLHRITGLPWVADFRDTMSEDNFPPDPMTWKIYRWIERQTVEACSLALFTAPGALRMYASRYPDIPQQRWKVILNGYDEADFENIASDGRQAGFSNGPLTLLHSGVLYASERDPNAFFAALGELKKSRLLTAKDVRIVLRGSGEEVYYRQKLAAFGIEDIVHLEPTIPYREALREMMQCDGLLVFQAANCNQQIPAKIFEYFRAQKPILTLTDPSGDTAAEMRAAGANSIFRLDSVEEIKTGLSQFVRQIRTRSAPIPPAETIQRYSRRQGAADLAAILNDVRQGEPRGRSA